MSSASSGYIINGQFEEVAFTVHPSLSIAPLVWSGRVRKQAPISRSSATAEPEKLLCESETKLMGGSAPVQVVITVLLLADVLVKQQSN